MTKLIIGYFCGTGFTSETDEHLQYIKSQLAPPSTIFDYDGCQIHGGGTFAYGVEEQADFFIAQLLALHSEDIQLNLIAQGRGALSALIVIKKIQHSPELKKRIKITADLRDPIPENFQLTTRIAGHLAIANQLQDLSDCDSLQEVHITLQEMPTSSLAYDALIPKFHYSTKVEIECIPGDMQQRAQIYLSNHGIYKTLNILQKNGHSLPEGLLPEVGLIDAYNQLLFLVQNSRVDLVERNLLFGGKTVTNTAVKSQIQAINWRHAHLINPSETNYVEHVLYGTTQTNYNYKKNQFERYCDLGIALDNFFVNNPNQQTLVEMLRQFSLAYLQRQFTLKEYKDNCQCALNTAHVNDSHLNKAINSFCLVAYFKDLNLQIEQKVPENTPLYEKLRALRVTLIQALDAEIQTGKSIREIEQSKSLTIANNTIEFLKQIYADNVSADKMISLSKQYADKNIILGRNWHSAAKIIVGSLVTLLGLIAGLVIGALISGLICAIAVLASGALAGTAGLFTAAWPAFIGSLIIWGPASAALGLGLGAYGCHYFFKPSPLEKNVQDLSKNFIDYYSKNNGIESENINDFALLGT